MELRVNDGDVLRRIAAGDEDALLELHQRYVNLVYSMAHYIVQESPGAEEITQDVFLAIWRRAATYDPAQGAFSTWMLTITRRHAIDYIRRRNVRPQPVGATDIERLHGDDTTFDAAQFDLRQALTALPSDQRTCLDLIYFRGFTQQETATQLNIPLGTVKSRVRLAMDRLRQLLLAVIMI